LWEIIEPLLSRFLVLEVPEYTLEELMEIALTRLSMENHDESIARTIAENVWNKLGSRDIRDVVKLARLAGNVQEIPFVIKMLGGQNDLGRKKLH